MWRNCPPHFLMFYKIKSDVIINVHQIQTICVLSHPSPDRLQVFMAGDNKDCFYRLSQIEAENLLRFLNDKGLFDRFEINLQ